MQYLGITHLCENAHFTYKILQYACFNYSSVVCNTCSYDKYLRYCLCTSILDCFGQLVSHHDGGDYKLKHGDMCKTRKLASHNMRFDKFPSIT